MSLHLADHWLWDHWICDVGDRYHLFFLRASRALHDPERRHFRASMGCSPYEFVMTRRVERAMALLRETDRSVTDICPLVGASSLGSFTTRFGELVGMTPTQYRERARRNLAGLTPCLARTVTKPVRNREVPPPLAP